MAQVKTKRNTLYNHGAKKEGTDTYYTPEWVTKQLPDIFNNQDFIDPCPGELLSADGTKTHTGAIIIPETDGLSYNWGDYADFSFVNPPFSDMQDWIYHAGTTINGTNHASLWFSKLDYRTHWGRDLIESSRWVLPVLGYVKYIDNFGKEHASATFQTCFAAFGNWSACGDLKDQVLLKYEDRVWNP